MSESQPDIKTAFVPPGTMVIGLVPPSFVIPGGGSFGVVAPVGAPPTFVPPGGGRFGMVPQNVVLLGHVGPHGTMLGLQHQPQQPQPTEAAAATPTGDGRTILAWEDDPATNILTSRTTPDVAAAQVQIVEPAPAPGQYPPHTTEFRYWTGAEAVTRGVLFWQRIIGALHWRTGATLPVALDATEPDFNAYYDRQALRFFHGDTAFGRVWSGESPDIVCHELGHAVLDVIKPQLWSAASHEAAAFHEAFGDISALLCALDLDSMRRSVLDDTAGRLYTSSRLSRMAEQLGAAIRLLHPQDVDPDCLRNTVNSFTYRDPNVLPHVGPASALSSEPHSFSRLFSGAFFEALATLLTATSSGAPTPAHLAEVAQYMARVLVAAIRRAPVVSNFFAQVAAGMVQEAAKTDRLHASVLRAVFVRRSILSPRSAASAADFDRIQSKAMVQDSSVLADTRLGLVAVGAGSYGISLPLALEAPSHPRTFSAMAAATDATPIQPSSALVAATSFADDIFRRGRVDYGDAADDVPLLHIGGRFTTHRLVADDGAMLMTRCCFDCGLRRD